MADISKITPPGSQTTYNLKDATAREQANWNTNNGVKNLLKTSFINSEVRGVAYTLNADSSITVKGTANSAGSEIVIFNGVIAAGNYIMSIGATMGSGNYVTARYSDSTETAITGNNTSAQLNNKNISMVYIYIGANKTVDVTIYPMLTPKSLYDADPTYEPYALPSTKITPELIELVDSGAKNFFKPTITSGVDSDTNLTLTVNSDNTITVSGTAATSKYIIISQGTVSAGDYVFSGTPSGITVDTGGYMRLEQGSTGISQVLTPVDVTLNTSQYTVFLRVLSGKSYNYTLKPMICTKAAWDVSQKYVPYRPSYEETVEQVAKNENNISLIEQSGIHKNNLSLSLAEMKSINASGQGATWSDNICTINGVTFTVNDDYTITVGGQLSGSDRALFRIFYNRPNSWGGQYLVGCPSGGSVTTYKLNLEMNGSPWSGIAQDTGSGSRVGTATTANIYGYIDIHQTDALNLVFKPMIITEAMYNAGFTDYQQYAPTMGELYQMILALQ